MANDIVNRYNPVSQLWERVKRSEEHEPGAIAAGTLPSPITKGEHEEESEFRHPVYKGGSVRSVAALRKLRFDPIEELVNNYRRLRQELHWHEQVRSGHIVPLDGNGKVRNYSVDGHMRVYERLESIAKELLRYGYGRVPETLDLNFDRPQSLVINLTKKGEVFEINKEETPNGD